MMSFRTRGETKEARKLVKQVAELIRAFNIAKYINFYKNLDLQGLGKRAREVHRRFNRGGGGRRWDMGERTR